MHYRLDSGPNHYFKEAMAKNDVKVSELWLLKTVKDSSSSV
jgi:hypothetical protein